MNAKGVIFDLDGTLVNSLEDIADSTNAALQKFDYPVHDVQTYKQFVGHGIGDLIVKALPESAWDAENIERCQNLMMAIYRENCLNKTRPYDGIGELLDKLVSRRIKLAVFSNKSDDFTKHIVSSLLSNWNFEAVIGLSNEAHKKPNPLMAIKISQIFDLSPDEIVYVGDSAVDMQTANKAGMYAVGVLWGYQGREELLANGAQRLLNHPWDLLNIL
ncbi:MAG TPA: HAD family hydrolase [Caldithrix sp.]|nr:HAD family hydrolase [Caldithrix sp.]